MRTSFEAKMRSAGKRFGFDLTVVSAQKDTRISLVEIDRGSIAREGKSIRASIRYNPEKMAKYGNLKIIAEDEAIHCILNPEATYLMAREGEKAAALTEALDHMVLLEHINAEYLPKITKKAGSRLDSLEKPIALQKGLPPAEKFYGKVLRAIEESGAKNIEEALGGVEALAREELGCRGEEAKNTALVICIVIGASNNPSLISREAQEELLAMFGAEEACKSINYPTLSNPVRELYRSLGNDKERRARYMGLYDAAKNMAITRKHWW